MEKQNEQYLLVWKYCLFVLPLSQASLNLWLDDIVWIDQHFIFNILPSPIFVFALFLYQVVF